MKQVTTNNRTWLFVPVPDDAVGCMVLNATSEFRYINPTFFDPVVYVQLPSGNYRFIATTDTITDEQAAMFVERYDIELHGVIGFKDYAPETIEFHDGEPYVTVDYSPYESPIDSFKSLLQHHSITGRHAIIEVL